MPGVTDYSDDELPELLHIDELPPPPPLTGVGYSGMHRRPSPQVPGDEWTRDWVRASGNDTPPRDMLFEPSEVPITHTPRDMLFDPEVSDIRSRSGSWSTSSTEEDVNTPSWWFAIPYKLRTDDFWKHMFAQPDFFLVNKKIDPEQKEAIDTIMSLLHIGYKGIYNTSTRRHPLKSPFPEQVNVTYVKQYLNNVRTTLSLTPEDRYRFEMILMNYLMFAPMKVLKEYIARIPRRGGKTRRKSRKHKSKRV